ncbi:MAG: ABC transporter permease [Treponema sp.]|jgi:phospholipid/cholesterol/gamma-HCH transport system permease protein|nr:ABC transporter permease [Treponema sp.]
MGNLSLKIHRLFYKLGFFARTLQAVSYFVKRWNVSSRIMVIQIFFTCVQAMGISSLLALGIGAAVNIIGLPILEPISQQQLIYPLLIIIITRELGPLLTAFIVIARSATAIATEIAGMVINHEVEAYIATGVDPIEHLAVPRFLGVTVSVVLLNIYFSAFGLAGSYVIAWIINSLPAGYYFSNILNSLSIQDIFISIIKSIAFGMIISIVAITEGLSVERARTEVPVAGLKAVGNAFAGCIVVAIILTAMYYIALA